MLRRKPRSIKAKDWQSVDSPPLTKKQLESMRPARDLHPEIVASYQRRRGTQKTPTKRRVTIRLDRDVIEHFEALGPGWQTRLNAALRALIDR
jgi:uncharacterized protein (DUF4415 family)